VFSVDKLHETMNAYRILVGKALE